MTHCRDPEEFDEFFHVNVAGLFATIKAFYPLLQVVNRCCMGLPILRAEGQEQGQTQMQGSGSGSGLVWTFAADLLKPPACTRCTAVAMLSAHHAVAPAWLC